MKQWDWRSWLLSTLFLALTVWITLTSSTVKNCISNEHYPEGYHSFEESISYFRELISIYKTCTGEFIHTNGEAIISIFTVILAISTIALWQATNRLWKAGEVQLSIAKQSLHEIERAFIFIDDFEFELSTGLDVPDGTILPEQARRDPGLHITRFAVQPRWKNAGSTATTVKFKIDWRGPHPSVKQKIGEYRDLEKGDIFLAPRAIQGTNFFEVTKANALIAGGLGRGGDDEFTMMLIWGRGDYADIFGKPHFIEWCYRVRFDRHSGEKLRAQLIQWGNYNRSD